MVAKVQEYLGSGVKSSWYYSTDNKTTWIPFTPNLDTSLDSTITDIDITVDVTGSELSPAYYQMNNPVVGAVFLQHMLNGDAIFLDQQFVDNTTYPNQIKCYLDIDAYGTNGSGLTSITPYITYNEGKTWVEIPIDKTHTPTAQKSPFMRYLFSTVAEVSVGFITNATPMVVTSNNHGFTENMPVNISGVQGTTSANGEWIIRNVTANTFELYATDGVTPSVGSGAYTTGGVVTADHMSQIRPRVNLKSTEGYLTPRVMNVSFICTRV
jgi:hypothetical protein